MGQKILDIGPFWHKKKEGTPTMGGVAFVVASCVAFFVFIFAFSSDVEKRELYLIINIFVYAILNSMVGMIDDLAKIKKQENKGLSAKGKLILQGTFAILFLASLHITVGISTTVKIPLINTEIDIGIAYYIVAFFLLCGVVNAVNLTDGLDGLASTCVLTSGAFLTFVSFTAIKDASLTFFGAIMLGATLSFLIFNLHPAKIFMGDTGSLYFGALVVGSSFAFDNPLIVLLYGFIFILEAVSVILQVIYFKLTKGKRLFKMAPLHHHLEKCGYGEIKIVSIFGIINVVFCVIAFILLTV